MPKTPKVDMDRQQLEVVALAILEELRKMARAAKAGRGKAMLTIRPCYPEPASFCPGPTPGPWGKGIEFRIRAHKYDPDAPPTKRPRRR